MKWRNWRSRSRVIGLIAALIVAAIWLSPIGAPDAAAQFCRSLLQLERRHPKFSVKRMLRRGRYVIAIRHGDKGARGDSVPDLPGCLQPGQSLTNHGKEQARQIGAGLRGLVREVKVSPYCRTMQTAIVAFGRRKVKSDARLAGGSDKNLKDLILEQLRKNERSQPLARKRKVNPNLLKKEALARAAARKRNVVLVTHSNLLAEVEVGGGFPLQDAHEPENLGRAAIFNLSKRKKRNRRFLLGCVLPQDWRGLK